MTSKSAIQKIMNGSSPKDYQPLLQILEISTHPNIELTISDGEFFHKSLYLSSDILEKILNGTINQYQIIKLEDYIRNPSLSNNQIVISSFTALHNPYELIGDPKVYENILGNKLEKIQMSDEICEKIENKGEKLGKNKEKLEKNGNENFDKGKKGLKNYFQVTKVIKALTQNFPCEQSQEINSNNELIQIIKKTPQEEIYTKPISESNPYPFNLSQNPSLQTKNLEKKTEETKNCSKSLKTLSSISNVINNNPLLTSTKSEFFLNLVTINQLLQLINLKEFVDLSPQSFSVLCTLGSPIFTSFDDIIHKICVKLNCKSQVFQLENKKFRCDKCKSIYDKASFKYLARLRIFDPTGNLTVTVFNNVALALFKETAEKMHYKACVDFEKAKNALKKITGRQVVANLNVFVKDSKINLVLNYFQHYLQAFPSLLNEIGFVFNNM